MPAMKIDPNLPKVTLHGIEVAAGDRIEDLRLLLPEEFERPSSANAGYEHYSLRDEEMAGSLSFKEGQIYQVSICLFIPEDATSPPYSRDLAEFRGAFHRKELRRMIGADRLEYPDGSRVGNYFDPRNISDSIVITFPLRSVPPTSAA
jgi:hypothetical protein